MNRILPYLFAMVLAGCASVGSIPTDYSGIDGGKAIIGIGATSATAYSSYSLLFKRTDLSNASDTKPSVGRFTYFQLNTFYKQTPDYQDNTEAGIVLVQSLPPGQYEIYNFDVFFNGGTVQNHYSSRTPVSIPFTIKAGEVVYLGNYQANGVTGKNIFGLQLPAGAFFVVSNRLSSEMAIAQRKDKDIFAMPFDYTPDVNSFANPLFVKSEKQSNTKR